MQRVKELEPLTKTLEQQQLELADWEKRFQESGAKHDEREAKLHGGQAQG